jgi:hypothetical protein
MIRAVNALSLEGLAELILTFDQETVQILDRVPVLFGFGDACKPGSG